MGKIYTYMRISTQEERGKQQYSRQENSLKRYAEQQKIKIFMEFRDDASGKNFEGREQWQKLDDLVQSGDTIIFKDLSRFTREAENGYAKYMELMERGVSLVFIDNPSVSTDYVKKLLRIADEQELVTKTVMQAMVKILLIAELDRYERERLDISKRTRDGMRARKEKAEAQGIEWHPGRKTGSVDKLTPGLERDIRGLLSEDGTKKADLMRRHNVSRNTLQKYIKMVEEEKTL